jgi:hypothetical protein
MEEARVEQERKAAKKRQSTENNKLHEQELQQQQEQHLRLQQLQHLQNQQLQHLRQQQEQLQHLRDEHQEKKLCRASGHKYRQVEGQARLFCSRCASIVSIDIGDDSSK